MGNDDREKWYVITSCEQPKGYKENEHYVIAREFASKEDAKQFQKSLKQYNKMNAFIGEGKIGNKAEKAEQKVNKYLPEINAISSRSKLEHFQNYQKKLELGAIYSDKEFLKHATKKGWMGEKITP